MRRLFHHDVRNFFASRGVSWYKIGTGKKSATVLLDYVRLVVQEEVFSVRMQNAAARYQMMMAVRAVLNCHTRGTIEIYAGA